MMKPDRSTTHRCLTRFFNSLLLLSCPLFVTGDEIPEAEQPRLILNESSYVDSELTRLQFHC